MITTFKMKVEKHMDSVIARKREIRKEMTRRLLEQDVSDRQKKSLIIQKGLLCSGEFVKAKTVMAYVSLPTEVDTGHIIREALKQGKRVGVPYIRSGSTQMVVSEITIDHRFEKGPYGISQPYEADLKAIPLKEIDMVIVPAMAYDENNMRLGRGKGFYDDLLSGEDISRANAIGIAFGFQKVKILPSCPHDRPVHRVITDQN